MRQKRDSSSDTYEHRSRVQQLVAVVVTELISRGAVHDSSKLTSPEKELFDNTDHLEHIEYGSEGYKESLKNLQPALDHHYAVNRHHPQHFQDGLYGMHLVDLIEMLCDWYASTELHKDGDIHKSIQINRERFDYDDLMASILENTADFLNGHTKKEN